MSENPAIETHPWAPWLPSTARVLFMGTFPPGRHRWSMDFYYPNPQNDFWRIMGLIFLGEPEALRVEGEKRFDIDAIKRLTAEKGIAMSDSVKRAIRLRGNASDNFLQVVEANEPAALIARMPLCHDIATTGEKAAKVIAEMTGTKAPAMGEYDVWTAPDGRQVRIWRMPSTSRAFASMKLEGKAAYYESLFRACGIL